MIKDPVLKIEDPPLTTPSHSGVTRVDVPGSQPPREEQWAVRAAKLFLVAWALIYLVQAVKASIWFDGFPDNGPFQIFNPLRRIAAGQVGGRDFIFFHGIGVPYLHYPLFALFGGKSLIASELSRQLTSFILFVLSLAAFVKVTLKRPAQQWIGAAIAVMFMEALFPWGAAPGHSLVSARATMPIFAFAALQLPARDWVKALLVGLCIALGFLCGTEHGIAIGISLVAVSGITLVNSVFLRASTGSSGLNFRFTSLALASGALFSMIFFLLLCGVDGSLHALHYNLVELPANQFWFFGSPPLPYLGAWRELILDHHVVLCLLPTYFALGILGWLWRKSWNGPLTIGRDWQALAMMMLVYGVLTGIPLLAILSRHYVFPMARILALTGLLIYANRTPIAEGSSDWWTRLFERMSSRPSIPAFSFIAICLAAATGLLFNATKSTAQLVHHFRSDKPVYSQFLNAKWDTFMADATALIDSKRKRSTVSLWSVYTALLESHYGISPPAEDYIIHAAGSARWRHYVATFEQTNPEFVQTRTQDYDWQESQQNEMWEFFEDVLDNYEPLKIVGHALIWQRTDAPWRQPFGDFQNVPVDQVAQSVVLPVVTDPGPDRIGVVRVRYHVKNQWGFLPLLGKTPRYLVTIEGSPRHLPVSFPPGESEFQFPVQLQPGKPVTLHFKTDSLLPGAAFETYQVQIKILDWQQSQRAIYARAIQGTPK